MRRLQRGNKLVIIRILISLRSRLAACLLFAASAYGSVFSDVTGIVHDPDHRPIAAAHVGLRAVDSTFSRETSTNAEGEFRFPAVPLGNYDIDVRAPGFAPAAREFVVISGSAPVLHFQLKLAVVSESVEAVEQPELVSPESSAAATLVGRAQIERTPGASRTNSLAMITDYVPGAYVTHDQLHIRGGHQVTWMVDGVPVPNTNIASNVGPQFDPKDADYIEVQRGGYSAEYGDRAYGVFNVVPATGFERNREGDFDATYGSFHQTNSQLRFGSHTERFAWYASANGNRSDYGLQTPGPAVLHDTASGAGVFSTLIFNADARNQLRAVTSLRTDRYFIPNTPEQETAGIRDVDRESDAFINFSWVHTAGTGVLVTVSPFYHFNRAAYVGGPNDLPYSPGDDRRSHYAGAQATLAATTRRHNTRTGFYGFAQHDDTLLAATSRDAGALSLRRQQALTGNLEAVFAEDQYKPTSWLTLNGGVRLTRFSGTVSEDAVSPRAGAAFRMPRLGVILRGFFGKYYQEPPLSTVSGPLLGFVAGQGFGFLPLHGERDQQWQVGATVPLHGWAADLDYFETRARNYFDHAVLGNSNIFFPVSIERARIKGWEATLRSPRLFRRGDIHVAYSHQLAQGEGTVTGGITDFSEPAGTFLLDHDQRHTLNTGFDISLPFRTWAAGNVYYGSGFADNSGPSHLPGHTTVDLTLGKTITDSLSVSLTALNAANRRFLLDNSETFGGTHYAGPREVYVGVKYRFRY